MDDQKLLWDRVYETLQPKDAETAPECLNRLTNERKDVPHLKLNAETTIVRLESWPMERIGTLDSKHQEIHEFEDERPIVVVELENRDLLVDGNHRVAKWMKEGEVKNRGVLVLRPTSSAYEC